jgi:type VI secretion system protein ImpM
MGAIGLYGKIAAQPDFLRFGAGGFSGAGLDRWLQEGVEILRAEKAVLPTGPTAFLVALPHAPVAFVGAFAPSVDAAGRSFPLALFTEISTTGLIDALPSVPFAYSPFVAGAATLVLAGETMVAADIGARAQSLSATPMQDVGKAWEREPVKPLVTALGGSPSALAYALRTLLTAIESTKSGAAATNTLTVDSPAPTPEIASFWLEIVRRCLRGSDTTVSLLWTNGPEGRLLVTFGALSPTVFAYLANPRHRSSRLWPLRTTGESAMDQAMAALTGEQRRVVEDPAATLGELASKFE